MKEYIEEFGRNYYKHGGQMRYEYSPEAIKAKIMLEQHRYQTTRRQAARQFGISKSTVHKDITERLMQVNPALAKEARKVLDINKSERHIRGGMATKEKYEHEHLLHACQRAVS